MIEFFILLIESLNDISGVVNLKMVEKQHVQA